MGVVKVLIGHKRREVIEKMLDFVEGRITVYEFWDIYKKNDIFKQIVKKKEKFLYPGENYYYFEPEKVNLNKLYSRMSIYWRIKYFLRLNKIKYNPYNPEEERYIFLGKICPHWITLYDCEWLEEVLDVKGKSIKEMGTIKSLKEKFKTLFKYEKYPPKWIQQAEWPIIDGVPAVFIRQSVDPDSNKWEEEPIDYYFKDSKGKEIIVTQLP